MERRVGQERNSREVLLSLLDERLSEFCAIGGINNPAISYGAAVFLYQLASERQGNPRLITDLDLLVSPQEWLKAFESQQQLGLRLTNVSRRTTWGFSYHNPILEGEGDLPIDVMSCLNTEFPATAPFFGGEIYTFPDPRINNLLRTVEINGRTYTVASPTLVMFYKITQMREGISDNGSVKQDSQDIEKLHQLDLFNNEDLNRELNILTYGDDQLRRQIIEQLNRIVGGDYSYLELERPPLSLESLIGFFQELTNTFNEALGQGRWCFSNGTALFFYSLLLGDADEIRWPTDIDIFFLDEDRLLEPERLFFNTGFGRIQKVIEPVSVYGISYQAPQLRGRLLLPNGQGIKVDIIARSIMIKNGSTKEVSPKQVEISLTDFNINDSTFLLMGLNLIAEIKEFEGRPPPKMDMEDLKLISRLR